MSSQTLLRLEVVSLALLAASPTCALICWPLEAQTNAGALSVLFLISSPSCLANLSGLCHL